MNIIRKARGEKIPQNAQRVFLSCDPRDKKNINSLVDNLLAMDSGMDCVVSYLESNDIDNELLLNEVLEVSVLVLWITEEIIQSMKSNNFPAEYIIAREHNIPILPIAENGGLLTEFTKIAGAVHGLARDDIDYKVKLKEQLELFLASDELIKDIQDKAFTASLFLSYRKRDILEARDFMRKFHDLSGLDTVSIWYDNFLTAGRDFNDEIKEVINKNDAFVLLVTPNLATEGNYVQLIEYPYAKENGKVILSVEAKETDQSKYTELYPDAPQPINIKNQDGLLSAFKEKLFKTKQEQHTTSENLYLLGQAYLKGFGLERDIDRAIRLFEESILGNDNFSLLATNQLSEIYENGISTSIDYEKTLFWRLKTEKLAEKLYGINDPNTASVYNNIGNVYRKINDYIKALGYYDKAINIYKKVYGEEHILVGMAYSNIGKAYIRLGKSLGSSVLWHALKIFQKNFGEEHIYTANAYMDIGINHIENDFFQILHDLENSIYKFEDSNVKDKGVERALENFNKALNIYLSIYGMNHYDTAQAYSYIGKSNILLFEYERALENINIAEKIMVSLFNENHLYLGNIYTNYGLYYSHIKDVERSLFYYEKAIKIQKEYFDADNLAITNLYNEIGNAYLKNGKQKEATEYFIKDVEKLKNDYFSDPEHVKYEKTFAESQKITNKMYNKMTKIKNHKMKKLYLIFSIIQYIFKTIKSLPYFLKILYGANKLLRNLSKKKKTPQEMIDLIIKGYKTNFTSLIKSIKQIKIFSILFFLIFLIINTISCPISLIYYNIKNLFHKKQDRDFTPEIQDNTEPTFENLGDSVYSAFNFMDKKSNVSRLPSKICEKYIAIADIFFGINDYEKALTNYLNALEMKSRLGMENMPEDDNKILFHKISLAYLNLCDYENAINYINKAIGIIILLKEMKEEAARIKNEKKKKSGSNDADEDIDSDYFNRLNAKIYTTLGDIYFKKNEIVKAIECYIIALEIHNKLKAYDSMDIETNIYILNYFELARANYILGNAYKVNNEPENAIKCFHSGIISTLNNNKNDNKTMHLFIDEIVDILIKKNNPDQDRLNIVDIYYKNNKINFIIDIQSKNVDIDYTIENEDNNDNTYTYKYIANIYWKISNLEKANEYFEKSLTLLNKIIEEYKNDAESDDNEHLELLENKLEMEIKLYDENSIQVAKTYYAIGLVYKSLGNNEKRLEYYKKGLEIRIKVQGEEHEDVATQYNNVAVVYNFLGEREKAIENHNKAIAIRLKILGEEHKDLASSYSNMGYVYRDNNEYRQALDYFWKALNIYKKCSSKKKQLEIYYQVISMEKEVFGEEHEAVAFAYTEIGGLHFSLKEYDRSLENAEKGLEIRKKIFGDEHINTAASYYSVGAVCYKLKKYQESLEYHTIALELRKKLYKDNNYDISLSLLYIGLVYKELKDTEKALEYLTKSLEINKELFAEDDKRVIEVLQDINDLMYS